jgi:glycosyltransferase involved in cell wall biosynthesis
MKSSESGSRFLYLFTAAFPYGPGESFLETELPYLAAGFTGVVILPATALGEPRPVPANVRIDRSLVLSRGRRILGACMGLANSLRGEEIRRELRDRRRTLRSARARRLILHTLSRACAARAWLLRNVAEAKRPGNVVVYTYWLGGETLGAAWARADVPELRVVSRAHGYDLYEERHDPAYLPFRNAILAGVDAVFPVSDHGVAALRTRSPRWADRVSVARLGVRDPSCDTLPSTDGVLRIVSCSFLVAVKRVQLLIAGLAKLSERLPTLRVVWTHIGDGQLRAELEASAKILLPRNVEVRFLGRLDNRRVLDVYRSQPVDVFVNVSESEGVPVSIMEAQSFGIPVVATAVGGTPEIVTQENGVLLPADPDPGEIAAAIGSFSENSEGTMEKRRRSKQMWRDRYDAERNFPDFVRALTQLTEASRNRVLFDAEGL